jgi:hypothetical protein
MTDELFIENVDIDEYGDPIQAEPESSQSEEPIVEPEVEAEPQTEVEQEQTEVEPEPEPLAEEPKKVQSSEENARFAEQRRQQQLQKQIEEARKQWEAESPQARIARALQEQYGIPPEQILSQLEEARLAREAERLQVPVEYLKRAEQEKQQQTSEIQSLRDELNRIQFESWNSRIEMEKANLAKEYPMLSSDDLGQAAVAMLQEYQNPNMPLKEVVIAKHWSKIESSLREQARQEALAQVSGRAKSPLAPQGGKPLVTATLTDEERWAAKLLGMSEEDYLKYK